jgi:hypothetical protein
MKELHCHPLVRSTAVEMAGELYDAVMHNDDLYEQWKKVCPELTPTLCEITFIELLYPRLIEQARATLAKMLATNIPESQKLIIYDALVKDATLIRGRKVLH